MEMRLLRSFLGCAVGTMGVIGAVGCQPQDAEPPPAMQMEMPLAAPPAGQGVQYKMASTLSPGLEIERCLFVKAPPEGLNINRDEVRYTPGSHHVLLYLTSYKDIPTVDSHGKTRDTSGVIDCAEGASADWNVTGVLAGAQTREGGSMVSLPPDVGVKVPGGAVMLINAHYLNASAKSLDTEVRMNLWTVPDDKLKQEGGILFWYNPFIRIPGESTSAARMRCKITKDITVANVQSHMHKRGVGYVANLLDSSEKEVETLYVNKEWENVPVKQFEPGKKLQAGSFVDYRCEYKNTETRSIIQGPSTKDEMCMLIGSYYPRNPELEFCASPTFVGSGNKSCAVTLGCVTANPPSGQNGPGAEGFYGCIVDSCPGVAHQVSDALFCTFSQGNGKCTADCTGGDGAKCQACILNACKPQIDACTAAKC